MSLSASMTLCPPCCALLATSCHWEMVSRMYLWDTDNSFNFRFPSAHHSVFYRRSTAVYLLAVKFTTILPLQVKKEANKVVS